MMLAMVLRVVEAGDGPAQRDQTAARHPHNVSILIGDGDAWCLGVVPRAKNPITIMRAPQQGHGVDQTRGPVSSANLAGCG